MVLQAVLFQLIIPLLLLVLFCMGSSSIVSITLRALIVLGYLVLAHWLSLWLFFPWYFFHAYLFILFALYSRTFILANKKPIFPGRQDRLIFPVEAVLVFGLLVFSSYIYLGRQPLTTYIVDLESPVEGRALYVLNGGSISLINDHLAPLSGLAVQPVGNVYAIDLAVLNEEGRASNDIQPGGSEFFAGFNAAIQAPCNGTVLRVNRDYSDQVMNELTGQIMLQCSNFELQLGHLIRDSILLEEGEPVQTGQFLGRLGSAEPGAMPYLHMHAQRRLDSPEGDIIEPVQISINGDFMARGDIVR